MSKRHTMCKRDAREKHTARIGLVAAITDYWFNREYPGAYCLDPENDMRQVMSDEEIDTIRHEKATALWLLTDEQLHRMVDATMQDYMRQTPLRNMLPRRVHA